MYKTVLEYNTLLVIVLCWIHFYFWSGKSAARTLLFFGGALFLGTIVEIAAILATESYSYPGFRFYIGPVPLFVAIGWGTIFHFVYQITNRVAGSLFSRSKRFTLCFALLAGLIGLIYDLNTDPVAASLKWWVWENGSAYFGVPVANFSGWFIFCMGFCGVYKYFIGDNDAVPKRIGRYFLSLAGVFLVSAAASFPFL